jgi:hypothetical protein
MIRSIILKEWLKLRYYVAILVVISIVVLGYFTFNLHFLFSTIEPESMMWYRFAHLEDKPYFPLSYLYLLFGVVVALVQFLPERIKNRIKIMAHLPLELKQSLFLHLGIGVGFILILSAITSCLLLFVMYLYYPEQIVLVTFKDTFVYSFLSISLYIGLAAAILEKKNSIAAFKFFLIIIFIGVLLKKEYILSDSLWLLALLFIPFWTLDSFYSVKEQRFKSRAYVGVFVLFGIALFFQSYLYYQQNYKHEFNKYYIFYSNIIKDFVYQKNFGEHQFEYGIKDKRTFDREEYESYLPFVYWRNLDIQNKLPIEIEKKIFNKKTIKYSRLGFSYHPKMLHPLEVKLYPLLNPHSTKGMIRFPEEMFGIGNKEAYIYNFDHNANQFSLTKTLNKQLEDHDFIYPVKHIWGKPSNMKPYDLGYLVLDSKNQLFNIKRLDDTLKVTKIKYPKGIDLDFIRISENKQKVLSGYAIDARSNFYLLTWDFQFIKLDLEKFDHKTMKLKLISNPINYLIRYDDGKNYYATVFLKNDEKNLIKVESVEFN